MPNFRSGNFKQKNKRFKGSKAGGMRAKFKDGGVDSSKGGSKKIKKLAKSKEVRKAGKAQAKDARLKGVEKGIGKLEEPPMIWVFFGLNEVDTAGVVEWLKGGFFEEAESGSCEWADSSFAGLKLLGCYRPRGGGRRVSMIDAGRDPRQLTTIAGVASLFVAVSDARHADLQRLNASPAECLKAIDGVGLAAINAVKALGFPTCASMVTGLADIPEKHRKDLKFYLRRQLEQELEGCRVYIPLGDSDIEKMLFEMKQMKPKPQKWRENRGYFIADSVYAKKGELLVSGVLQSEWGLGQPAYIAGIGAVYPVEVAVQGKEGVSRHQQTRSGVEGLKTNRQDSTKAAAEDDLADLRQGFSSIGLQGDLDLEERLAGQKLDASPQSDDEEDEETTAAVSASGARREPLRLTRRGSAELEFEDEVEFEQDELVRDRLSKYKYLPSFAGTEWDRHDSTPQRLTTFCDFGRPTSIRAPTTTTSAPAGARVTLRFVGEGVEAGASRFSRPFVVSSMLPGEDRPTLMHLKVRVHNQFEGALNSKSSFEIHMGFRKEVAQVIFSRVHPKTSKTLYKRKIIAENSRNEWFLASFFAPMYFPPANVMLFALDGEKKGVEGLKGSEEIPQLAMMGSLEYPDLFKVILKRVILTGYPIKSKKRTAVVRHMFFNPEDVKYFMDNEVYTRSGLRGKITQSLGIHGMMKCVFSGNVNSSDTICMNLYKRVFPPIPDTL